MKFDLATTRRLAIGLLAASGALLFATLNLVGSGVAGGNVEFTKMVAEAVLPLELSAAASLISFLWVEIADHRSTPEDGQRHSKDNYLQSALALLAVMGLGGLIWGGIVLSRAVADLS